MNQRTPNSRGDDRKEEKPPYSRLFIVCGKDLKEEELRAPFEKFGEIEDLFMLKNRNTGESKGVAYVKYSKTSSAAAAIQEMHMKTIPGSPKPVKVMVATNKNDKTDNKDEKYNRLFIKVSKLTTDSEIKEYFSEFGYVESVHVQKNKATDESKGLAYVQFKTFLDAAKAFENCDRKYRAVFAMPKQELKRGRDSFDFHNDDFHSSNSSLRKDMFNDSLIQPREDLFAPQDGVISLIRTAPQNYTTVYAICSPEVSQKYIEKLFNVIPGMLQFQYSSDSFNNCCKCVVTYRDERAAAHAVERLNNFEFPSGQTICVKPDNPLSKAATTLSTIVNSFKNAVDTGNPDLLQLADAIAQASTLIKAATTGRAEQKHEVHDPNYCSVYLPPPQLMASAGSKVAKRCFIVCKPQPPPPSVLKDVFRRFGDLIDVCTFPNKTFGFAKYASIRAAEEAISTLHGATVCGISLKVLEADERPSKDEDQKMNVDESEFTDNSDRKRMRLYDEKDLD